MDRRVQHEVVALRAAHRERRAGDTRRRPQRANADVHHLFAAEQVGERRRRDRREQRAGIGAAFEQQTNERRRAHERRGAERRDAGDRARRTNVDIGPVLDQDTCCLFLATEDGEVQGGEAVV